MEIEYFNIDTISSNKVLHAHIIASTIPRGTLQSIQFPILPEGYFSITYKDIPGVNTVTVFRESIPLLCESEIAYKGEPLAVICGPDRRKVISLCNATRIEYESDYSILGFTNYSKAQIIEEKVFSKGNTEKAFNNAFQTVEGSYTIHSRKLSFPGFRGIIAKRKGESIEIEGETQWPFHIQKSVAAVCKYPLEKVHVQISKFYPTYDEKLIIPSIYASLAAVLGLKSGKPIRLIPTEEEVLAYGLQKPEVLIDRNSALDEKGKIIAERVTISVNMGAYPLFTNELLSRVLIGAAGSYSIANMEIVIRGIRTSTAPMNVFRGLSLSSGTFSAETHISRIAGLLNIPPDEWRLHYLPGKKSYLPTGGIEPDFHGKELLQKCIHDSDFKRKFAAYEILRKNRKQVKYSRENLRGIGMSFGFTGNGPTEKQEKKESYSVKVRLDTKDKVTILSSANGSHSTAVWKETASDILETDPSSVLIKKGNTANLPNSGPSFLSSDISIITNLVEKCCYRIKKQRFNEALPIEVKRSYRIPGNRRWDPQKLKGLPFHSRTWGTAAVEVEIDPVLFHVTVRGVWLTVDPGKLYNKKKAIDTLESSILETLEWVLPHNDVTRPSTTDNSFNITPLRKLPEIVIDIAENRKSLTGGISELPDILLPAALISALTQATGIYLDTLPVTSDMLVMHQEVI